MRVESELWVPGTLTEDDVARLAIFSPTRVLQHERITTVRAVEDPDVGLLVCPTEPTVLTAPDDFAAGVAYLADDGDPCFEIGFYQLDFAYLGERIVTDVLPLEGGPYACKGHGSTITLEWPEL